MSVHHPFRLLIQHVHPSSADARATARLSPRRRRVARALSVLFLAVAVAGCSAGAGGGEAGPDEGREVDSAPGVDTGSEDPLTTTTEARSPFCRELDDVSESVAAGSQALADTEEGSLQQLVLTVGAIGDLGTHVSRLAATAPPEIASDLEAIEDALDVDVAGAVENPLGAIAAGLLQGLLTQNSFARVDAYAVEECGYPVFGAVALGEAVAAVSPRTEADGSTVIDPRNIYGEPACDGDLTALRSDPVSDGMLAVKCGHEAVLVFDVATWELLWQYEPEEETVTIREGDSGGGVLAVLLRDYRPASGLDPETEAFRVEAYDLAGGEQLWTRDVELHPQDEVMHNNTVIEIVGLSPGGTVVYRHNVFYHERYGAAPPRLQAVEPGGTEIWSTPVGTAAHGPWVSVDDDEGFDAVVNIDTGDVVYRAPRPDTAYNIHFTACSPYILDPEGSVVDGRTGESLEVELGLREVTPTGVLASTEEGLTFLDPRRGGETWTVPASVVGDWDVIDGAIVVRNTSGEHILLDPASGEAEETLPLPHEDVWGGQSWVSVDDGHVIDSSGSEVRVHLDAWPSDCENPAAG